MSGWRPTLALTNVISNLLHSIPTAGPSNHPETLENDDGIGVLGHSVVPGVQAPPGQSRNDSRRLDGSASTECLVCTSYSYEVEFSTEPPTSACSHSPEVCIDCLQQIILTAINSGDFITGVLCPSPDCSQKLDYYDVQKWATQEVFDRYDKLLLQNSLRTDGHYVLCLEPSCAAGQVHAGGELSNIVTCHHCGSKQCFRHQVLWHEGFTCEQWDSHQQTMNNQQEMTDEWIQTETKPCPGQCCGRRIQKDEGCDHMTCKRPGGCGHQFCWECFAPWLNIISVDNSRHYDNCQYYTGPPGNNPAPSEILTATATAAREPPPPPVTTPQQRPIFTILALQNGRFRPPARQPPVEGAPGEAERLARLRNRRARVIEDHPAQEIFADAGRERPAPRGRGSIGGFNPTRQTALPRHDQPAAAQFWRGPQRGDNPLPRGPRNDDRVRRVADPNVYDPRRHWDQREPPREPPNHRSASDRDRELRRIEFFRARPGPPPPPRTRPLSSDEELPNGVFRHRRLLEDPRGETHTPTTGPRSLPPHLASRFIGLAPGSPQVYLLNSLFGPRSPQRLEPLHDAPSTSQAAAAPRPETRRRRGIMDPAREAEISAWAENSNVTQVVQPNRSPEQRSTDPFAQLANNLTQSSVRFGGSSHRDGPGRRPPVSRPLS